jgi:hypothetical protein
VKTDSDIEIEAIGTVGNDEKNQGTYDPVKKPLECSPVLVDTSLGFFM